jgi:hypothetical protein
MRLDADVRGGRLVLVTRPGIVLDTDDVAIRTGHVRVKRGPAVPVILRIEVAGNVCSGTLTARPRRSLRRSAQLRHC